ncbi:MAG: hypothetical protein AAGC55_17680 [Myxococcota bacterium]
MITAGIVWLALAPACGDDGGDGGDDAGVSDDAGASDAAEVDAAESFCDPGLLFLTGEYIDWDSAPDQFLGVVGAMVSDAADDLPISATTAPNGRLIMCLSDPVRSPLTVSQPDYVRILYTADAAVMAVSAFSLRGLTPARRDLLFTEIGRVRDVERAQLLVSIDVTDGSAPGLTTAPGEPAIGAGATLDTPGDGTFVRNAAGNYVEGATLSDGRLLLFSNVPIGDGTVGVTITPPAGATCSGPARVTVQAGELSAATFVCEE